MGTANLHCFIAAIIGATLAPSNRFVQADEQLETVVAKMLAAAQSAKVQLSSAVGNGRFEYKTTRRVDGEEEVLLRERGPFTAAYSGDLDFLKFTYEDTAQIPSCDARVYVNDGEKLWNSEFSPRIRPHGAKGEIWRLIDGTEGERLFCVLPLAFPGAWTYIDRVRKAKPDATAELMRDEGRQIVVIAYDTGYQEKFFVDPTRNHHVVEFQLVMPDGKPLIRVMKHWAKTEDKLWYVQKYVHEDFPRRAGSSHHVWTIEFTSFAPNADLPEALFTSDALGLPVGSRVIDRTTRPEDILEVEPPKVERIVLESVIGPLPQPKPGLLRGRAAQ